MTKISQSTPTAKPAPSRMAEMVQMANGVNAARVVACFLVVLLHSAMPYMATRAPVFWLLHDTSFHISVDALVIWINGFVMALFFLLAGMSIAKTAMKRPFKDFAWHRISRLGATFLLATALIMPLLLISWGIGFLWTERLTMDQLIHLKIPDEIKCYLGPAHLWFVEYLLLLSVGWSAIARTGQRWEFTLKLIEGQWVRRAFETIWGPLLFAVPTFLIFACDFATPFRLTPSFIPDSTRALYYFMFFIAGVWLSGSPGSYSSMRRHAPWHLLIAATTFVGLFPLTLAYFQDNLDSSAYGLLAVLQAVFSWYMVFGFLGAMMRWCSFRHESIRYLSEASFWLYLAHFPIVCIMQLVVWTLPLNLAGKLFLVFATGIVLTLVFYETCVRYSWLGAVINGRRKRHEKIVGWRAEATWMSLTAVGTMLLAGFLWTGWELVSRQTLQTVVDHQIYRSNRLHPDRLDAAIESHQIRSVISLSPGTPADSWFKSQQQVCDSRDVHLTTFSFDESRVPSPSELDKLQLALENTSRPVLLIGGKRSPTLASFASAVGMLVDECPPSEALRQFDLRYFQLDGAEHCIMARPLREYRDWLNAHGMAQAKSNFGDWTRQMITTQDRTDATENRQPTWQALMGAPRFPRRF